MNEDGQQTNVTVGGPQPPKPHGRIWHAFEAANAAFDRWHSRVPVLSKVHKLFVIPLGLIILAAVGSTLVNAAIFGPQNVMSHIPLSFINPSSPPPSGPSIGSSDNGSSSGSGSTRGGPCNHTGVSGSSGNYTFTPLAVNAQGVIVSRNNPSCTIRLNGINLGWWTAETTGDPVQAKTTMDFLTQHLHYNIIRVAYNSRWVKDNPADPAYGGVPFRTAFDSFIQMAKQHGLYVELDLDSQFVLPPCDPKNPRCSQPSQGAQDWDDPTSPYYHDMTGQELAAYQPTALWTLNYLAATYKNDPSILFDVWNEPAPGETKMPVQNSNPPVRAQISEDVFFKDMQERAAAVAKAAPEHFVIIYIRALNDIISNPAKYPVFTQQNVMYDNHIYKKDFDQANLKAGIAFAHSHGQAYVVGEWGGAPGYPEPNIFLPILRANNANSTYFAGGDLYDGSKKNPTALNAIGQAVDAQYQITFRQ